MKLPRDSKIMFLRIDLLVAFIALYIVVPVAESIAVMSIDLGSEWIKVAIVKPGVPMEIVLNKESRRKTPVVVSMKGDERFFSDPAMSVAVRSPDKAYLYVPLLLGKKFEHPSVELYKSRFPHYKLVKDESRGTVLFEASSDRKFSPEELMAMILNNSRIAAENFADHVMKDVVITVPVYYNQAERKAIINAAKMVGLNILQLMNDNTAVALHYGIFRSASFNDTERCFMFYNMGASSTTATIVGYKTVKTKDKGYLETVPQLEVKGVGFDSTLGGFEMELRLRDHLASLFQKQNKAKGDVRDSPRAMMKLLKEAKRVKQVLSANTDHFAQIENLYEDQDFKTKVTRQELEDMCKDLFDRVAGPLNRALKSASMRMDDIESVILMGGGTRVPEVQELLLKAAGKKELGKNINTDEAAALGAVYKAADLTQGFKVKRFLVKDMNIFPIDVSFQRRNADKSTKVVTRTLFHNHNPVPQKKVMTFNKQPEDFHFNVSYGDTTSLPAELLRYIDLGKLSQVSLTGVGDAHSNNKEAQPKGVKAFFNMDESFILNIEKIEAHFEKMVGEEKEEEQSTFAKLGNTLSNLFGSGKKETPKEESKEEPKKEEEKQEKKPEEKKEGKEEAKKTDKANENLANNGTINADAKNATNATDANSTVTKEPSKPVLVKESIQLKWSSLDVPGPSEQSFEASVKLLNELQSRDEEKLANEKAKNALESFLFEFREKLYNEEVEKMSTEEERNKISDALSKVSDWLDDEGYDTNADAYKKKLKGLKDATDDLRFRIAELQNRPKAIAELLNSLNLSTVFLKQVEKMPEASEIYTDRDLKDLQNVNEEAMGWLMSTWKKQNETSPTEKPVLLVKDVISYQGRVDRELLYLINKAKYYVPKPKPKVNETDDKTSNKTSDGTKNKTAEDTKTDAKTESTDDSRTKSEEKSESTPKTEKESSSETESKEKATEKPVEESKTKTEETLELPGGEEQKPTPMSRPSVKTSKGRESAEKEDSPQKSEEASKDAKNKDSEEKAHGEL